MVRSGVEGMTNKPEVLAVVAVMVVVDLPGAVVVVAVEHGMAGFGVMWSGMMWRDVEWRGVAWCGLAERLWLWLW